MSDCNLIEMNWEIISTRGMLEGDEEVGRTFGAGVAREFQGMCLP